jgi:hypothetical protein
MTSVTVADHAWKKSNSGGSKTANLIINIEKMQFNRNEHVFSAGKINPAA